jgi:uncharacterized repeat protein (TIGR03803 family)
MSRIRRLTLAALATPLAAHAGTLTTLYRFTGGDNGGNPFAPLIYINGALYGILPANYNLQSPFLGAVFKVDAATGAHEVVHAFQGGADGAAPALGSGLIYVAGAIYGTTAGGGGAGCVGNGYTYGCGTIYSINPATNSETVLYDFAEGVNGNQISPEELVYQAGTMYGTTLYGGASGDGSVFSFALASSTLATVHSFTGGADGATPNPDLLYQNGLFYGTTLFGGGKKCKLGSCGTLFTIDPVTNAETILHVFGDKKDGIYPLSNLVYHNGALFGSTGAGGSKECSRFGCGVSFALNAATGSEKVIDTYAILGESPPGMILVKGNLYETVSGGATAGQLIEVDPKTGQQTVLYTFSGGLDGGDPMAQLTYHSGAFYGTTAAGGGNDNDCPGETCGTVFKFVP